MRIAVAQSETGLRNGLIDVVWIGRFLDLTLEPGQHPLLIVGKGQSSQGSNALRLQRAWQGVQLLAWQPFAEQFEIPPTIIADRLQRQMIELAPGQRDFLSPAYGGLGRVRIGIDAQESQERQLVQIAEAVQESAAQFEQGLPSKTAQADDDRRPQRPGVGRPVKSPAVLRGFTLQGGKAGVATLVDSTSYVLPRNPQGATLQKE